MAIPNKHAINIATKGILSGDAKVLAVKGYILGIAVQVIPIYHPEGGVDLTYGAPKYAKKHKKKKVIRVTVFYAGEKYIEEKLVDEETEVTTKDIKVDLTENQVKISIRNIDF